MAYINAPFDLANSASVVIPLDRWGYPSYSVQLTSGTSVLVEGTLDRVNRGETPTWKTLDDDQDTALAALLPADLANLKPQPLEAIRITATGACVGRVMQTGAW